MINTEVFFTSELANVLFFLYSYFNHWYVYYVDRYCTSLYNNIGNYTPYHEHDELSYMFLYTPGLCTGTRYIAMPVFINWYSIQYIKSNTCDTSFRYFTMNKIKESFQNMTKSSHMPAKKYVSIRIIHKNAIKHTKRSGYSLF